MSLFRSPSSSFSIFPYLLLSTGGGGGRPNSLVRSSPPPASPESLCIPVIHYNWRGGGVLINHPGSPSFHVPPNRRDRKMRDGKKKKEGKNLQPSVSDLLFDVRPIRPTGRSGTEFSSSDHTASRFCWKTRSGRQTGILSFTSHRDFCSLM